MTPSLMLEVSSNGFTGIVIIFSLSAYCSKIPEYMLRIKTTAGFVADKYLLYNSNCSKNMRILKGIRKKQVIYLSAGNILHLNKSLLLSAFGTLFTYGLLIVNLKTAE
ncbi:uncharacterized protein NPIL_247081 [Nephila pilipes]|uniref:Uncharacterized protein n=1 Tax=Nephila pilipes TaxID=299642 RepID=A0A8X6PIL8_NEPPI|nr:uncharacterized protein NPIL_247081 [Nephila pilipes]